MLKRIGRWLTGSLLTGYTMVLIYWMILGFGRTARPEFRYNLRPLHTIRLFSRTEYFNLTNWAINMIGNIVVFVPFGILLPLLLRGSFRRSASVFLTGIILLESLQLVTRRGSFDVDDILLNSIGFTAGFVLYRIFRRFLIPKEE